MAKPNECNSRWSIIPWVTHSATQGSPLPGSNIVGMEIRTYDHKKIGRNNR